MYYLLNKAVFLKTPFPLYNPIYNYNANFVYFMK